jgi:hypothetical protein
MDEDLEEPLLAVPDRGPELDDLARVVENIRRDEVWTPGQPSAYGAMRWRPDLTRDDIRAVLHVHLAERLRPYVIDRMTAAQANGHEVHLALPLSQIYDEDLLYAVHELDAQIHVIRSETLEVAEPSALLTVLCDARVQVTPKVRTLLATTALEFSEADGSAQLRGRRYEALIAFLLSQVSDFDVVERNLRTDTEELDVVVQQRATHGRVWSGLGAPLILVEAKNWKAPVTQKEASAFRVKLDGRRGVVRLGLMFGAGGFTSDALDQELRFASDELTIAFVRPEDLNQWIGADDGGDEFIETLVRRAMLR